LLKDAIALDYLSAVGIGRVIENLHRNIPGFLILDSNFYIARERAIQAQSFSMDLKDATRSLELFSGSAISRPQ